MEPAGQALGIEHTGGQGRQRGRHLQPGAGEVQGQQFQKEGGQKAVEAPPIQPFIVFGLELHALGHQAVAGEKRHDAAADGNHQADDDEQGQIEAAAHQSELRQQAEQKQAVGQHEQIELGDDAGLAFQLALGRAAGPEYRRGQQQAENQIQQPAEQGQGRGDEKDQPRQQPGQPDPEKFLALGHGNAGPVLHRREQEAADHGHAEAEEHFVAVPVLGQFQRPHRQRPVGRVAQQPPEHKEGARERRGQEEDTEAQIKNGPAAKISKFQQKIPKNLNFSASAGPTSPRRSRRAAGRAAAGPGRPASARSALAPAGQTGRAGR